MTLLDRQEHLPQPAIHDRHGPGYRVSDVSRVSAMEIATSKNNVISRKARSMSQEIEKSTELVDEAVDGFTAALNRLLTLQEKMTDSSKRCSGNVRDSANKLAEGLAKIEKAANFDRLDRIVGLLERAAAAMSTLAELEGSGKLAKISASLK